MADRKKQRFNAFDDLSESTGSPDVFAGGKIAAPGQVKPLAAEQIERIERLRPSQMLPDRFQPRRLLPAALRAAFFSGKIDCYQASREWLSLAQEDAGLKAEVERLLSMGGSFETHGQIKPVTGSWASLENGQFVFLIETGERRFWAACLRAVKDGAVEEPLLRVEVVPNPSRQRQVIENRHAETPSAVGQACEVAALILAELSVDPPVGAADEFDYFRQARGQRMPAGMWERVTPIMQLTRPRMVQLLNILQLPTGLLDLADRYRLPERVLREILAMPREQWEVLLVASIRDSLTSDDLALLKTGEPAGGAPHSPGGATPPEKSALIGLRRFAGVFSGLDARSQARLLDETADRLVVAGQAESILPLLDELERLLRARLNRR